MDELTKKEEMDDARKSARRAPPSAGASFPRTEDADATLGTSQKGNFQTYPFGLRWESKKQ